MPDSVRIEDVVGEIKVLHLEPGDTFVFTTPTMLTQDAMIRIRDKIQSEFHGVRAVVLDGGSFLSVVRQP